MITVKALNASAVSSSTDAIPSSGLEYSAATGLLYAAEWDAGVDGAVFLSIDLVSGWVSQLGVIPGVAYVLENSAMSGTDYYAIMADASKVKKLVHVSVAGGGFSAAVTDIDTTGVGGGPDAIPASGLEYSVATGLLYAYEWDAGASEVAFLSVNPATGKLRWLGVISGIAYGLMNGAMSGTDYYAIMADASKVEKLVHVSVAGGGFSAAVKDIDTTGVGGGSDAIPSSVLDFSAATGLLYAYEWDAGASEVAFLSVNPATGELRRLGAVAGRRLYSWRRRAERHKLLRHPGGRQSGEAAC